MATLQDCYLEITVDEYCKKLNNIEYAGRTAYSADCLVTIKGQVVDAIVNITTNLDGGRYVVYVDGLHGDSLGKVRPSVWNDAKARIKELHRDRHTHAVVRIKFDPS